MTLNEFHEAIRARNAEVFANNHHTRETAALAVISEIGEMCNAVVGVMGCEERKKDLTNDDILDGIGDAAVYTSVLADKCGVNDLDGPFADAERWVGLGKCKSNAQAAVLTSARVTASCDELMHANFVNRSAEIASMLRSLSILAERFGCTDFLGLLAKTFNHVSERSGSTIRVSHD